MFSCQSPACFVQPHTLWGQPGCLFQSNACELSPSVPGLSWARSQGLHLRRSQTKRNTHKQTQTQKHTPRHTLADAHTNTPKDTHTHTQTHTNRHAHTHSDTHTSRHRHTHTHTVKPQKGLTAASASAVSLNSSNRSPNLLLSILLRQTWMASLGKQRPAPRGLWVRANFRSQRGRGRTEGKYKNSREK